MWKDSGNKTLRDDGISLVEQCQNAMHLDRTDGWDDPKLRLLAQAAISCSARFSLRSR